MFIYAILDIVFNNVVFEDVRCTMFYSYISIGFVTVCFFIALYLHQRFGDRNINNHQSITDGFRNCCRL